MVVYDNIPDGLSVDLNMPDGMDVEQRRQWLREIGAVLIRETGLSSGQIKNPDPEGHPQFFLWWAEEEDDLLGDQVPGSTGDDAAQPAAHDLGVSGAGAAG